eukprot:411577-Rhodomonas_salina.3
MTHYSEDNGTSARAETEDETNAIALPFPKLNGGAAAFGADANAFGGEENGTLTLQVDENDPSVGLAALQLASSDFEGLPQQQQTLIGTRASSRHNQTRGLSISVRFVPELQGCSPLYLLRTRSGYVRYGPGG